MSLSVHVQKYEISGKLWRYFCQLKAFANCSSISRCLNNLTGESTKQFSDSTGENTKMSLDYADPSRSLNYSEPSSNREWHPPSQSLSSYFSSQSDEGGWHWSQCSPSSLGSTRRWQPAARPQSIDMVVCGLAASSESHG